jgi:hypothetical protein
MHKATAAAQTCTAAYLIEKPAEKLIEMMYFTPF